MQINLTVFVQKLHEETRKGCHITWRGKCVFLEQPLRRDFLFICLETVCKRQTDHPIFLWLVQEDTKIGQETYNPFFLQSMQKSRADKRQRSPIFDQTDMQNKQTTSDNITCLLMLYYQLRTKTDKILPTFWRITRMECKKNITVAPRGNFAFPAITTTI